MSFIKYTGLYEHKTFPEFEDIVRLPILEFDGDEITDETIDAVSEEIREFILSQRDAFPFDLSNATWEDVTFKLGFDSKNRNKRLLKSIYFNVTIHTVEPVQDIGNVHLNALLEDIDANIQWISYHLILDSIEPIKIVGT